MLERVGEVSNHVSQTCSSVGGLTTRLRLQAIEITWLLPKHSDGCKVN